jgi:RNA recognition motif-containing protein
MDPAKLYVGSLPESVDDNALRALFERHGALVDVAVVRNPDGTARGFGFVKFASEDHARGRGLHSSTLELNLSGSRTRS